MNPNSRKRLYRWGGGVAAVIITLAILIAVLPFGVRWWITDWFDEQGLSSELERVQIDLWNGSFGLQGLEVNDEDKPTLQVGSLRIDVALGDLFNKTLTIRDLQLENAFVRLRQEPQQALSIAGIVLGGGEAKPAAEAPSAPWNVKLQGLQLRNVETCYDLKPKAEAAGTDGCARLKGLQWTGMLRYAPTLKEQEIEHLLQGELDLTLDEFETSTDTGAKFTFSFNGLKLSQVTVDSIGQLRLGEVVLNAPNGTLETRREAGGALTGSNFSMASLRLSNIDIDVAQKITIQNVILAQYLTTMKFFNESGAVSSELTLDASAIELEQVTDSAFKEELIARISVNDPSGTLKSTRPDGAGSSTGAFKMKALQLDGVRITDASTITVKGIGVKQHATNLEFVNETGKLKKDYQIGTASIDLKGLRFSRPEQLAVDSLRVDKLSVLDEGEKHNPIAVISEAGFSKFAMQGASRIRLGKLAIGGIGMFFVGADPNKIDTENYNQYLNSISATDVDVRDLSNVALNQFIVDGAHVTLQRGKDGGFEFERPIEELMANKDTSAPQQAGGDGGQREAVRLTAKRIKLNGDSEVKLIDGSFEPTIERRLRKVNVEVSDLDTGVSDSQSPFLVSMLLGENGEIRVDGKGTIVQTRPTIEAKGKIRGVDLGKFSAYAEQVIKHQIQSGLLEADLDIKIQQGKLDSLVDLTLHKFYIDAAPKKDTEYEKELGMPLSTALSLLREKDDSIHIKLPVKGDVTSPDFSLRLVLRDVVGDAIKQAIISYYTPFGVVTLAGAAFDILTALRFKPVEFEAGAASLDGDDRAALDKIASMLKEREKVRLVVCGKAVLEDRITLFDIEAEQAQKMRAVFKTGPETPPDLAQLPSLSEQDRLRLNALAEERTTVVKNYLMEQGGIAPERLIECNPQYEAGEAGTPRTMIGV